MTTSQRTALSPQQAAFFKALQSGEWDMPNGIKNNNIRPHEWLKHVSYGHVHYEWPNDGTYDIQPDRLFGGWVACLSDHIVSMTMASALDDGEWFTTTELTTRLFRPVSHGLITIKGNLISRGRTSGFVEADWKDDQDRLLVRVSAVKAIRTFDELQMK